MELGQIKAAEALPPYHVIFTFGSAIPSDYQGRAMLACEKMLREMGLAAECFKTTKEDDSKLRRNMTKEQRENL